MEQLGKIVTAFVSKYAYTFIIKELSSEFHKQFQYLGKKTKKLQNLFSANKKRKKILIKKRQT